MDDNTRMPWEPVTGGSNVPAINDFLLPAFGMALGGTVFDGVVRLPGGEVGICFFWKIAGSFVWMDGWTGLHLVVSCDWLLF